MSSFNQVTLLGNVGNKSVNTLSDGTKVCNLSIATNLRGYKRKNGEEVAPRTDWHNVVLWRRLAEVAEKYVKKGMQVQVLGELRNRTWTDKEGRTHYVTEVMCNNLFLLGKSAESAEAPTEPKVESQTKQEYQQPFEGSNQEDDDLPF